MEQAKSFIANLDANKTMSWFTKKKPDGSKSDNEEEPKGSPQSQPQAPPQAQPQPSEEGDLSGSGQTQYKGVHGLYNPLAWENMPKSLRDQFPHWKDNTSSVPAAGGASTGEEAERKFQFPSSFKQPDNTIPYVVMEHDTLNGIALKFDTTPSQLAHLNRKQLGMVSLIPGEVLYVPDSQRGEGEDDSSSLFTDDVSPKSAPPELKAFLFPATQRPPAAADGRGTGDPLRPEGGEHMTQQGKDAREVRSASPNLGTSNEVETTTIACTYVTEDQGCVRGTLIFSASSIHFRPDPADRLVQEKGEDSYDIQMFIQDLVFVGLSGDPHCAVNQRTRKPGGTAQATVTQEERAVQPQALSDSSKDAVFAGNKMVALAELNSSSSGSRQGSQGCPPVTSQSGSPVRVESSPLAQQANPSQKKRSLQQGGEQSSPVKSESVPALHQGDSEMVQPPQDSSALRREAASSEAAVIARAVSSPGVEAAQPAKDGSSEAKLETQGVPDQDKPPAVAASNEPKPLSDVSGVKREGSLPKEECDFAQDKGSPSKVTAGAPCKDEGVAVKVPSSSGATGVSEVASVTSSSPLKPTNGCTTAATAISTPKKESYTALDGACVSETPTGGPIPVAFEVGLSPLKLDAGALGSICTSSDGGIDTVSTPVKDSTPLSPSHSASAFDLDKTIVASEDPLAASSTEQSQQVRPSDTLVEEAGACKDLNPSATSEAEAQPRGGGGLEGSEHLEGKEVVGVDPLSGEPVQGWDESHEKCGSPTDDVRFLNVRISNKSNQKYTYMPVTIGYSMPKHLQYRNSFVRTGFCFAIPDSSIDGIVASVMRHHPSAHTPAKQARQSAVIINLEQPEELVISNEHFEHEHDWEIYSWKTEDTREPSPEPLPVLRDKADLLDEKLVRQLVHELLPKAISCDWVLLYSTFKHGISLQTLYRNIREYDEDSPLLLLVRDEYHKKFGVMLSSTMRISTHFLGTGESYLFSVEDFGKLEIYHWSGINDYVFQGNSDSIVFGSDEGHFGLWLHESLLRGTSSPCATFNNPCLSTNPEFECTGVEVWGFVSELVASDSPAVLSHLSDGAPDTANDLLLAQMLQLEFDREHDSQVKAEERHMNKRSKVKVTLDKFCHVHPYLMEDSVLNKEEEEEEEEQEEEVSPSRGHGRSKRVPAGVPTKHDAAVCGRRNVRAMEREFPPSFPCGDLSDSKNDFQLSNTIYNVLRGHSQREERISQRLHEKKEHSTQELALDQKTRLLLFKLVDSGLLKDINGCISTGKEACVFHAYGGSREDQEVPPECAIKVYKTTLNEFKHRRRYIKDDYRFNKCYKHNPRKIVKLWAEKEMHNLWRLQRAGIPCPKVVLLRKHVLIMSFIGHETIPAPKLKEAKLTSEEMRDAYKQCTEIMRRMYTECGLVHADLSEYNLLWYEGRIHVIDVSQSVEPTHENAHGFLLRDCSNMSDFFSKAGVADVMTPHQLFNFTTGMDIQATSEAEFMLEVSARCKRQQLLDTMSSRVEPSTYAFDHFFDQNAALLSKEAEGGDGSTESDDDDGDDDDGGDSGDGGDDGFGDDGDGDHDNTQVTVSSEKQTAGN